MLQSPDLFDFFSDESPFPNFEVAVKPGMGLLQFQVVLCVVNVASKLAATKIDFVRTQKTSPPLSSNVEWQPTVGIAVKYENNLVLSKRDLSFLFAR